MGMPYVSSFYIVENISGAEYAPPQLELANPQHGV
jgi:hypothetical protein